MCCISLRIDYCCVYTICEDELEHNFFMHMFDIWYILYFWQKAHKASSSVEVLYVEPEPEIEKKIFEASVILK